MSLVFEKSLFEPWEAWLAERFSAIISVRDPEGTEFLINGNEVNIRAHQPGDTFVLIDISVKNKGTGLGTKVMESLREYVEENNLDLEAREVVNPDFIRSFSWLEEVDGSLGEETGGSTYLLKGNK